MSWTEERIDQLRKLWEAGSTASQIAEELGGVSRNAVIGKAHRLGLQSRPSPVRAADAGVAAAPATPAPAVVAPPTATPPATEASDAPFDTDDAAPVRTAPLHADAPAVDAPDEEEIVDAGDAEDDAAPVVATPPAPPPPIIRSIGPGGFLRQGPGDQQPPATPAPPRRMVPAKPSADMAGKTSLLELNDKICKWPIGHPGEPDFHFCGRPINPGFPYCLDHCSVAYQAQLPRRDRRPPPPLPFGGPRVR